MVCCKMPDHILKILRLRISVGNYFYWNKAFLFCSLNNAIPVQDCMIFPKYIFMFNGTSYGFPI